MRPQNIQKAEANPEKISNQKISDPKKIEAEKIYNPKKSLIKILNEKKTNKSKI